MIKTSESVMIGHPDKICDQVAEYILTKLVKIDPDTRAGIECLIKDDLLVIAGEISTKANVNYTKLARACLFDIGLNGDEFNILEKVSTQSEDIALGVDKGGAGDQGIMVGYATNETESYLPLSYELSRKLVINMCALNNMYPNIFGLDGKCQVSIRYQDNKPLEVVAVVVSIQTRPDISREVYEPLIEKMIGSVIPKELVNDKTKVLINPTGEFVKGGSYADSGVTGRKLGCDSYGTIARHGFGNFNGKDLSKVDRSGAYYARYVAKNVVASGIAKECEITLCYAIGVSKPIGVSINTFGTGKLYPELIEKVIKKVFDFSTKSIIKKFGHFTNFYKYTTFGHFGNPNTPWESLDAVKLIKDTLQEICFGRYNKNGKN